MDIRITAAPFDPHAECAAFAADRADAGALVSFVGLCRQETAGRAVTGLTIDHYEGFSEGGQDGIGGLHPASIGVQPYHKG